MNREITDHPLQSIMSRTGSFPLRVAYNLLKEYCKQSSVIFDPFCGKGTTLLAARMLGQHAYGMDIAPEAVISSLAKLVDVSADDLKIYIKNLPKNKLLCNGVPNTVKTFFHSSTLSQILSIREKLLKDSNSKNIYRKDKAIFVLACLLGILHGHSSISLSISSAHAYSMAPAYVARYAAKKGLKPPKINVKYALMEKISKCLEQPLPKIKNYDVRRGSALYCCDVFPELIGKIDLILTSPPYLNAQTYAKDNWLRLWLLGYDYKVIKPEYIETSSIVRYGEYMKRVFKELNLLLKPGGRLICIAGDVRLVKNRKDGKLVNRFETGKFLEQLCRSGKFGLRVEKCEEHQVVSNRRYFHALSNSNGHSKNNLIESVFVARKI